MNCHLQKDVIRNARYFLVPAILQVQNKEQQNKRLTLLSVVKFPSITRQTFLERARKPKKMSLKLRWELGSYLRNQRHAQDKSQASRPKPRALRSILTTISFVSKAVVLSSNAQQCAVTFQTMTE